MAPVGAFAGALALHMPGRAEISLTTTLEIPPGAAAIACAAWSRTANDQRAPGTPYALAEVYVRWAVRSCDPGGAGASDPRQLS